MSRQVVVTGSGCVSGDAVHVPEMKRADPFVHLAMAAAQTAVAGAGLDFSHLDPFRCGVVVASRLGGITTLEAQHRILRERGPDRVSALLIPRSIINAASGAIATHYQLKGPGLGLCCGRDGLAAAVQEALRWIRFGLADVVIAGVANSGTCPWRATGLTERNPCSDGPPGWPQWPALDEQDEPDNGACMLVLEHSETARQRGASILAKIPPAEQQAGSPSPDLSLIRDMLAALADSRRTLNGCEAVHSKCEARSDPQ